MQRGNRVEASRDELPEPQLLVRQLERISNLLALLVTHGKPQSEQISVLTGAGYSPAEIATLIGTTANTVSVTLYQRKSGKKKAKKKD